MGYKPGMRKCARRRCKVVFKKRIREHIYCSKKCRDAAAQERLRERAKMYGEHMAELHGALGAGAGGD